MRSKKGKNQPTIPCRTASEPKRLHNSRLARSSDRYSAEQQNVLERGLRIVPRYIARVHLRRQRMSPLGDIMPGTLEGD